MDKDTEYEKDLLLVIGQHQKFEQFFRDISGIQGKGLAEQVKSLSDRLPMSVIKSVLSINRQRNAVTHSTQQRLRSRDAFSHLCEETWQDLQKVKPLLYPQKILASTPRRRLLEGVTDKRNYVVPCGKELKVDDSYWTKSLHHHYHESLVRTLGELNDTFAFMDSDIVVKNKNNIADWLANVFGEIELAEELRSCHSEYCVMDAIDNLLSK